MMKVRNLGFGCNDYLLGFISIKVAKFLHWLVVPNITFLLYQGLGPTMLVASECSEEMLVEICRMNSVLLNDAVADGSSDCYIL